MKKGSKRVIPGFGLSLGVTLSVLSIVVLIPLASLVVYTAKLSPAEFWETITRLRVLASFRVSLLTAFAASAINAVMGVILAWVLVRYRFPMKRLLNGMIELPFALPTAVAGIALTSLTADTGLVGKFFARFGIQEFAQVRVRDLSTGMKQKVSLVISLVQDPEIIIFDEPTNGLDILTAKVVTDFLLDLKEQGKTIIISTHIFSLVEKICDRVGIIINGRMAACEDLRTLCGDKSLEDRFFEIYEAVNGEDENHDK